MAHDDQHLRKLADRVIEAEGRAVSGVRSCLDATFLTVARLLAACRGKVVVVGSGTSGAVAARAAHLFSVGGTPSFHLAPADGLHGGLGVLRRDDVVLALSKGGASKELNDFCRLARPLCGALVTVTARRKSELVTLVDHAIVLSLDLDADLGGVIATGSSLAAAAALDALVEVTRLIRGYSWEQFHYTHPGGAVGQESKVSLERLSGRADGA